MLFDEAPWLELLKKDTQYQLIWDDKVFNHIDFNPIVPFIEENSETIYIGNLNLFNTDWESNELHFAIAFTEKGKHPIYNENYVIECRKAVLSSASCKYQINRIDKINEIVHELNKKYLPISPDWEETNTKSLNFIKNKPFGQIDNIFGPEEISNIYDQNDELCNFSLSNQFNINLKEYVNKELVININEKKYYAKVKETQYNDSGNNEFKYYTIGNISIPLFPFEIYPNEVINTEEPFLLFQIQTTNDKILTFLTLSDTFFSTKNYKILLTIQQSSNLKLIDTKWLPKDEITSDWNEQNVNSFKYIHNRPFGYFSTLIKENRYHLIDRVQYDGQEGPWKDGKLEHRIQAGETYIVKYNGTTYTLKAENYKVYVRYGDKAVDLLGIGNPIYCYPYPDTPDYTGDPEVIPDSEDFFDYPKVPFFITNNAFYCVLNYGTGWQNNTFSLYAYQKNPLVKIEKEWLPDDIGVQSDWNEQNTESTAYIKNKPTVFSDWNEIDDRALSYIHNKPTNLDFQADWNEKDSNSLSFIKNKPNISEGAFQSDWESVNVKSASFIHNKPFGEMPAIIEEDTYNFESTGVSNINVWIDGEITYIPENAVACMVTWNDKTYYVSVDRYYGYDINNQYVSTDGLGNPKLWILNGGIVEDTSNINGNIPFFIDLANEKVYTTDSNSISIKAKRQTYKKIDSKYLNGQLLPEASKALDGYTLITEDGSWVIGQQLQSDWEEKNNSLGTFIKNKPFGPLPPVASGIYAQLYYDENTGSGVGFSNIIVDSRITIDKTYTINFNNQIYNYKCKNGAEIGYSYFFGNAALFDKEKEDTGEPFLILIKTDGEDTALIATKENYSDKLVSFTIEDGANKLLDNKYLQFDKTLTKSDHIADAKAVGNLISTVQKTMSTMQTTIAEMENIIESLNNQIYNLTQRIINLENNNNSPSIPTINVSDESLILTEGTVENELLELNYGFVENETLIFENNTSTTVIEEELNINSSVNNEILNGNGIVTIDGVWEI